MKYDVGWVRQTYNDNGDDEFMMFIISLPLLETALFSLVNFNVLLITQNVLFIVPLMQYLARLDGQLQRKYFYSWLVVNACRSPVRSRSIPVEQGRFTLSGLYSKSSSNEIVPHVQH